eukprot:PhM_4_TR16969/c0_g1_i1/m.22328
MNRGSAAPSHRGALKMRVQHMTVFPGIGGDVRSEAPVSSPNAKNNKVHIPHIPLFGGENGFSSDEGSPQTFRAISTVLAPKPTPRKVRERAILRIHHQQSNVSSQLHRSTSPNNNNSNPYLTPSRPNTARMVNLRAEDVGVLDIAVAQSHDPSTTQGIIKDAVKQRSRSQSAGGGGNPRAMMRGPLTNLNGTVLNTFSYVCCWPPAQPSRFSPKGYLIRINTRYELPENVTAEYVATLVDTRPTMEDRKKAAESHNTDVVDPDFGLLVEVVDLFCATSYITQITWSDLLHDAFQKRLGVPVIEAEKQRFLFNVKQLFGDASLCEDGVSIQKGQHHNATLTLNFGVNSTFHIPLFPSEEYRIDTTQYPTASTQHILSLLIDQFKERVESQNESLATIQQLCEENETLSKKLTTAEKELESAKREIIALKGNQSVRLEFPDEDLDARGVPVPLLWSTRVRSILNYLSAKANVDEKDHIDDVRHVIRGQRLHTYSRPNVHTERTMLDPFREFLFGVDIELRRLSMTSPLDRTISAQIAYKLPKSPATLEDMTRDPAALLREGAIAFFNKFNLRSLYGVVDSTLATYTQFAPDQTFAVISLFNFINLAEAVSEKLLPDLFPLDIMSAAWACVAVEPSAPATSSATIRFLLDYSLLTDDSIPDVERDYFTTMTTKLCASLTYSHLMELRATLELTLSDAYSVQFDRKDNFTFRFSLLRLLFLSAIVMPFAHSDFEVTLMLCRKLYAGFQNESLNAATVGASPASFQTYGSGGSAAVGTSSMSSGDHELAREDLVSFHNHVFVHFVRPTLRLLGVVEPTLVHLLETAEELWEVRKRID